MEKNEQKRKLNEHEKVTKINIKIHIQNNKEKKFYIFKRKYSSLTDKRFKLSFNMHNK